MALAAPGDGGGVAPFLPLLVGSGLLPTGDSGSAAGDLTPSAAPPPAANRTILVRTPVVQAPEAAGVPGSDSTPFVTAGGPRGDVSPAGTFDQGPFSLPDLVVAV